MQLGAAGVADLLQPDHRRRAGVHVDRGAADDGAAVAGRVRGVPAAGVVGGPAQRARLARRAVVDAGRRGLADGGPAAGGCVREAVWLFDAVCVRGVSVEWPAECVGDVQCADGGDDGDRDGVE